MLKNWQIVLLANLYGLDISRCQLTINCQIEYSQQKYRFWFQIEWSIPWQLKEEVQDLLEADGENGKQLIDFWDDIPF